MRTIVLLTALLFTPVISYSAEEDTCAAISSENQRPTCHVQAPGLFAHSQSSKGNPMTSAVVYHNGQGLMTSPEVLEELKLRSGQTITWEQAGKIIELNAAGLVASIELMRLQGKKDLPDTTKLREMLANKR